MILVDEDWVIETDVPHRSVSQLTAYSGCGERYRLERIAKVPQRPAGWTVQGHATHEAIEAWEKDRETSLVDLEDLYITSYRNGANALVEKWPEEGHWLTGGRKKGFEDLSEREDRGWSQVLEYITWARSQEHLWEVIDTEREFLQWFGDVPVRGFIDQIVQWKDGTIEPRDLKSGTRTPATAVQLITYAAVIERVLETKVRGVAFVKLANPSGRTEKTRETQYLPVDLSEEPAYINPDYLDQFFRDADRGITSQVFLPNADEGCERICSVSQFCRDKGWPSSTEEHLEGLLPLTVKEPA